MKSRVGRRQGITKIRKKQIRDLKRQKKRSMKRRLFFEQIGKIGKILGRLKKKRRR